jgi:hypothetical protein
MVSLSSYFQIIIIWLNIVICVVLVVQGGLIGTLVDSSPSKTFGPKSMQILNKEVVSISGKETKMAIFAGGGIL